MEISFANILEVVNLPVIEVWVLNLLLAASTLTNPYYSAFNFLKRNRTDYIIPWISAYQNLFRHLKHHFFSCWMKLAFSRLCKRWFTFLIGEMKIVWGFSLAKTAGRCWRNNPCWISHVLLIIQNWEIPHSEI